MLFCLSAKFVPSSRMVLVLQHGKVSELVLEVLATQAHGKKLEFAKYLLQRLHCTDEARKT